MDNVVDFNNNEAYVRISKERYEELIEAENWLSCLEDAGVDNWVGIDFAQEIYDAFNKDNNNDN